MKVKLTLAALALCMAVLMEAAAGFPGFERKAKENKVQYASWDEVNVIAHGLLQLGHGLKEHVDKTKGQIKDITAKLSSFNGTVAELSRQTQTLQEEGEVLKARARGLEERESLVLSVSAELKQRAEQMEKEEGRVRQLEGKVDGLLRAQGSGLSNASVSSSSSSSSDIHTVQKLLEAQNRRIDELVERIKQQQDKLDKQNGRIRNLQSQLEQRKAASPKLRTILRHKEEETQNTSTEQADSSELPADCHMLFLRGQRLSGVYKIQPQASQPFQAYCEMTAEGGWTVIQRRQDGAVDFDQLWQAYKNGFGTLHGEFWLGLEQIHALSRQGGYVLQVQLTDWNNQAQSVEYSFRLGGEESSYTLHLREGAPGNLENALSTDSSGLPFSTRDRDSDLKPDINCAKHLTGGWWFSNCGRANLNGKYFSSIPRQRHARKQGMFWKTWRGRYYPLKSTVMKIAPVEKDYNSS
ncbi:angiopoietin-related protein 4-like [Acipenser oxyrinchus oxyrinchus]|uniref:Angiopoietin-related protein 4-like n=1 Tax=Acipenser oxyrinchus oxyrinchus TaxID=40147 RepID=A0AAD8FUN2_ACIOX|nr:angiopoietin-related protein 4-like [Acipenser oxyrinchus oxyrinchus]